MPADSADEIAKAQADDKLIPSALGDLLPEQKIAALTLAYNKHVGALIAIESSEQSLLNLVLGIYSAALTLLVGFFKDEQALLYPNGWFLSPMGYVLVGAGAAVAGYTFYMSYKRSKSRDSVRHALKRIDYALGFFEPGRYLQGEPLYPKYFANYTKGTFLSHTHVVVYLPALAFILAVIILSQAASP